MSKRERINPVAVVIVIVIVFLVGKFFGLFQVFDIDPFGVEPEWVYGVLAIGIGVLYKEIKDVNKVTRERFEKIDKVLLTLGERTAKIEGILEKKK